MKLKKKCKSSVNEFNEELQKVRKLYKKALKNAVKMYFKTKHEEFSTDI